MLLFTGLNQSSFSLIRTSAFNHIARYAHKNGCTAKRKISLIYRRIKFKTVSKVLIIRFSAIGDVAMTIPVIYAAAKANPSVSFTVLTQTFLISLFINRPANVNVIGIDDKKTDKSLISIIRFAYFLTKERFDVIFDLHNVIRSRIMDVIFWLSGKRVFLLDKGRKERKEITKKPPKMIKKLLAMTERYADVFHRAGFEFDNTFVSLYEKQPIDLKIVHSIAGEKKGYWIGIAPFTKHHGKIYPIDQMEKVVAALSKQTDVSLFLFGGKGYEASILEEWASRYMHTQNLAGKYSLDQELALIGQLDVLVSMDSANMHFASLVDTKVISIWGATHPYAGFYGYRQSPDLAIQTDLPCRPCSIFGNKPCYRGDWACMNQITTEQILNKINNLLSEK